jgi:Ca2+-binding EF-hand superfamily protein
VRYLLSILSLIFSSPFLAAAPKAPPREYLPPALSWLRQVEAAQMLGAILSGTPPSSGIGWFHPGQSRYGLKWLVERMDKNGDGVVSKQEFLGSAEWFERLDRDHNGRLTQVDFDWSDDAPLNRQMRLIQPLFRRADADHDEKITSAEWQALFQQMAKGKDALDRDDLHALLFSALPSSKPSAGPPSPFALIKGLLEGEIGSFHEGPKVGQRAPDFTLPRYDNDKSIALSRFRGKKPVVLVFGSFT